MTMTHVNADQRAQAERDREDAVRYRKLRAWLIKSEPLLWEPTPGAMADEANLYGPTFDAAVDALPDPVSLEQELIDGKKPSRGYESGRDA